MSPFLMIFNALMGLTAAIVMVYATVIVFGWPVTLLLLLGPTALSFVVGLVTTR